MSKLIDRPGGYHNFEQDGHLNGYDYRMRFSDHYFINGCRRWQCFAVHYPGQQAENIPDALHRAVMRRANLIEIQLMAEYPPLPLFSENV